MIKLYSVHDHWTDINKKNDVDIESIDGVIAGIKVNGEDYGGIEWQNIYDNTITTVLNSDGFYTTNIGVVIEADSIKVTFDGVEYSCPKRSISEISTNFYGAPTPLETGEEGFDWTDFPFSIVTGSNGASMVVTTQTAGTHTLKIDTPQSGGGSEMLKIAKVTIVNNSNGGWGLSGGISNNNNNSIDGYGFLVLSDNRYLISTNEGAPKKSTKTLQAILMPQNGVMGAAYTTYGNGTPTVTGNAEYYYEEEIGTVYITGDCTITIS